MSVVIIKETAVAHSCQGHPKGYIKNTTRRELALKATVLDIALGTRRVGLITKSHDDKGLAMCRLPAQHEHKHNLPAVNRFRLGTYI